MPAGFSRKDEDAPPPSYDSVVNNLTIDLDNREGVYAPPIDYGYWCSKCQSRDCT